MQVVEGSERSAAERIGKLLDGGVLDYALCASRERWAKRGGVWRKEVAPLYRGYIIACSPDASGLATALAKLSFPARLAGGARGGYAPVDDGARDWLASAMDETHTVRASTGDISGGELRVTSGPLVGQESRVVKIDRHKRSCLVRISDRGEGFCERFALEVVDKD